MSQAASPARSTSVERSSFAFPVTHHPFQPPGSGGGGGRGGHWSGSQHDPVANLSAIADIRLKQNSGLAFANSPKTVEYSLGRTMFVWFAGILVNGMAALAVGLVVYLGWLSWLGFQQTRERCKKQKEREGQRRGHWGYE